MKPNHKKSNEVLNRVIIGLVGITLLGGTFALPQGVFANDISSKKTSSTSNKTSSYSTKTNLTNIKKPAPAVDLRFPGRVSKDAKREKEVSLTVETHLNDYAYLDACSPENWQSTGLYAAPGETVSIVLKDSIQGLKVQVGSHVDRLEDFKPSERLRAPVITVEKDLIKGETKVSNPYGGLIYIKPTLLNTSKPTTKITIKNAIKAPTYVLGETSQKEWLQMANNPKVPMAELRSKKVILTVPSTYIKAVKDPQKLMEAWNQFVDLENSLAGLSSSQALPNKAPQEPWRYVADIQISWGYLYAGYPIMLYDEPCVQDLLSVEGLQKNGWGFYHELGHNYQQDRWTSESLIEVSCNIFSLYVQEFYGRPSELLADNAGTGQSSFQDALQFVTSNRTDKNYNDESQVQVFTRLVMFWQLKEAYGWDLYPKLFQTMRGLPIPDDLEMEDSDRLDLMVEQLCKLTGDDLRPFFEHWGIRISSEAEKRLQKQSLKPLKEKIWLKVLVEQPVNQ